MSENSECTIGQRNMISYLSIVFELIQRKFNIKDVELHKTLRRFYFAFLKCVLDLPEKK